MLTYAHVCSRSEFAPQVKPLCEFTPEHWRHLVVKRGLADSNRTISFREFYSVLRECLYNYHVAQVLAYVSIRQHTSAYVSIRSRPSLLTCMYYICALLSRLYEAVTAGRGSSAAPSLQ